MEFFTYILYGILATGLLSLIYSKNPETRKTDFYRALYYPLAFIICVLLTPFLTYLLTLNVTNLEGARGYAYMYELPIIFSKCIIVIIIDFIFNRKRKHFFSWRTKIFSLFSILIISFGIYQKIKAENEQKEWKRKSKSCVTQFEHTYKGMVIKTSKNTLRIRKMDSTYHEFNYYFKSKNIVENNFFVGQTVGKRANYEKFEVILKNGKIKEFTIPCYE